MRRICSWCRKELEPEIEATRDGGITHGICSLCALKLSVGTFNSPQELLDQIPEPCFLFNDDGYVLNVNHSGCLLLGRKAENIVDRLTGDVIGCINAKLPGGCGHHSKCSVCTIRNSRNSTLETGVGVSRVTSTKTISTPSGEQSIRFMISTDLLDGKVLLRVSEFDYPEAWVSPEPH